MLGAYPIRRYTRLNDTFYYAYKDRHYTRHLSNCRCVGCSRSPESLTYVSSSGFSRLPPSCILKSIGYIL
ncbi:hypothetical protein EYY91_15935 [Hafnia alvei]|nr:hypothetical protein EYY91_15935 [Hafnia alvei]